MESISVVFISLLLFGFGSCANLCYLLCHSMGDGHSFKVYDQASGAVFDSCFAQDRDLLVQCLLSIMCYPFIQICLSM